MNKPNVFPKDWIKFGNNIDAVVCQNYKDGPYDIEVVFLDKGRATNNDAKWTNGKWELDSAPGGCADDYPRLSEYVSILRHSRRFHP